MWDRRGLASVAGRGCLCTGNFRRDGRYQRPKSPHHPLLCPLRSRRHRWRARWRRAPSPCSCSRHLRSPPGEALRDRARWRDRPVEADRVRQAFEARNGAGWTSWRSTSSPRSRSRALRATTPAVRGARWDPSRTDRTSAPTSARRSGLRREELRAARIRCRGCRGDEAQSSSGPSCSTASGRVAELQKRSPKVSRVSAVDIWFDANGAIEEAIFRNSMEHCRPSSSTKSAARRHRSRSCSRSGPSARALVLQLRRPDRALAADHDGQCEHPGAVDLRRMEAGPRSRTVSASRLPGCDRGRPRSHRPLDVLRRSRHRRSPARPTRLHFVTGSTSAGRAAGCATT